ncbi:penicillin-binding transpeptidase domain-containing protein [Lentisphaerota bacterium WC36G]|nr:hypothetical protein LJT99_09215 [Lentisphaerae bacterium WC36]
MIDLDKNMTSSKTFEEGGKPHSLIIRVIIVGVMIILCYLFLMIMLWNIQVRQNNEYNNKVKNLSIRRVRIPPLRGLIYSSDKMILADNITNFDLVFHLSEMRKSSRSKSIKYVMSEVEKFEKLIGRKSKITDKKLRNHMIVYPGVPIVIFHNLTNKERDNIFELSPLTPGVEIDVNYKRVYPLKEKASHILGYARKNERQTADDKKDFFYYIPDLMGKRGLELRYDVLEIEDKFSNQKIEVTGLRGEPGGYYLEVDNFGYANRKLANVQNPVHGNDIYLTLDSRAQTIAYDLLSEKGYTGAAVMLDVDTGAVIMMVSTPSFDNNKYISGWTQAEYNALINDKNFPLNNRAVLAGYEPGSVFKPLIGLALQNHSVAANHQFYCDGYTYFGRARVRCMAWKRGGHRDLDLVDALRVSCNDYFVDQGSQLGLAGLSGVLDSAGIGKDTGLEILPIINRGSRKYQYKGFYGKTRKPRWTTYDSGLLSIGQGIINLSPLQVAMYTAAIANGGKVYRPYLVKRMVDKNGLEVYNAQKHINSTLQAKSQYIDNIKEGMYQVVNDPNGSGKNAKNDIITLWGKTGSAEVGPRGARYKNTWFTCFGEYKGRRYSLVVLVERGHFGGSTCAPIARKIFERYLPMTDNDN